MREGQRIKAMRRRTGRMTKAKQLKRASKNSHKNTGKVSWSKEPKSEHRHHIEMDSSMDGYEDAVEVMSRGDGKDARARIDMKRQERIDRVD